MSEVEELSVPVEEVVSNPAQEEAVSNEAQVEDTRTEEQKVLDVKAMLIKNLNHFYGQLTAFIRQLPIDDTLRAYAIFNLDQGAMWVEQGVKKLQFKVNNPEEATNESQESNEEASQEVAQESVTQEG